jgi:hypothetical protein
VQHAIYCKRWLCRHSITPKSNYRIDLERFTPEFCDFLTMTKTPLQAPNDDRAWSQRRAAASSTRRWAAAWQVFLMLVVAVVVTGALVGIVLLLAGELRVDLSPQSSVLFFALVTAVGGVISVIVRRLQMLRSDERTHLEAMAEGQVQEHVWQLGLETEDVALMREMASAGEALNRGKAIPGTLTNQHLEQARLEAKLASPSPANPLSAAAALLQDALAKRSNRTSRS